MKTNLKIIRKYNFNYNGINIDFAYPIDRKTGQPFHVLCGYAISSVRNGSHNTINSSYSYMCQLKKYFEEFIEYNDLNWNEVVDDDIVSYLDDFQFKENKLSSRTIELQRQAIISFYKWAYKYGYIDYPMELDINCEHQELMEHLQQHDPYQGIINEYITKNEFNILLENIPGESDYLMLRNEIILMFGRECGLRTHEVTSKNNFKVDKLRQLIEETENKGKKSFEINIYGKGNNKKRKILITPILFQKLKHFIFDKNLRGRFSPTLPLFTSENGKPITTSSHGTKLFNETKKISSFSNIKSWDNKVFHSLRKTFATNLATYCYENGIDWRSYLPPRLGHESWEMSEKYIISEALMNNRQDVLNELRPKAKYRF